MDKNQGRYGMCIHIAFSEGSLCLQPLFPRQKNADVALMIANLISFF